MSTLTRRHLLSAEQVARRLGVRLPTVYAYVSRGLLSRRLSADGRTSRYDPAEVDALARRGRPRKGAARFGSIDVSLATSVTRVTEDSLHYRSLDATGLAEDASFEQVAELLWTGELPVRAAFPAFEADRRVARAVGRALPLAAGPIERFAALVAALAPLAVDRFDLRPPVALANARRLLAALVEAVTLPALTPDVRGIPDDARIVARLWPRLSPLPARPSRLHLLEAALVLTADHELATSTVAVRVAASARADPFSVVLAGLGTFGGILHGRASLRCHELLVEAAKSGPELALARARSAGRFAGFGHHPVYKGEDPRAVHLLTLLRATATHKELSVIDRVIAAAESEGVKANVDFALAAIAFAMRMPVTATDALFALARTAGWVAHALEEYQEEPLRFRARAIYAGDDG